MPVQHTTQATGTNDGTKQVSVNAWNEAHTVSEYIDIPVPSSTPADPASGTRVYTSLHANKAFLTTRDQNGVEVMVQPHIGEMAMFARVVPGTGTTSTSIITAIGTGFTASGANTYLVTTPATGSVLGSVRRYGVTSGTTASTRMTIRGNVLMCSQVTGFFFMMTVNLSNIVANNLGFFGLMDTTSAIGGDTDFTTSTSQNKIGLALNTNTGNWKLVRGPAASAPTSTDLGANFPINTTDFLRLALFCERDTTTVYYLIENLTSGLTTSGNITSNLPSAATLLNPFQYMSNNTGGGNVGFTSAGWHVEQYI